MRVQHPNITRLVGYCYNLGHQRIKCDDEYIFAHVEERVLCFEYLQGGSLDRHISDESCGLDWHTRFKIIKGVCEGLNYLHNGCKDPIYHLDLKPANILLDKNMIPKIGDFGLSRLFPLAQTYVTIKIVGTLGYMPPEYIERYQITSKFDVFSLGVIIIRIIAGDEGYSKCADMSSPDFREHVRENWEKRMEATMSWHTSEQIEMCIEIGLRCVELDRERRPTIAEIVDELNKVDSAESSLAGQVTKKKNLYSERRGRIVFSTAYRPPVPFDIFACPFSPSCTNEELHLTDGVSYNYNGCSIPPAALKTLLKNPKLAEEDGTTDADVDAGHVSGLIFVSERNDGLEILHIALHFNVDSRVKVFALADIFGAANFIGPRLEDSGCIGGGYNVGSRMVGHSLIYTSTKEPVQQCRSPWTVVYKTNLSTGKTERLTPQGVFDLSPAVSPSGKMVAVASFQSKSWNGEIENLKTDIYVMNVDGEDGLGRKLLIKNGGWPSWGSDNIIFFHRGTEKTLPFNMVETAWGVFRYKISTEETMEVTPKELDAVTPAAISETKVAVATIRQKSRFDNVRVEVQYRHIEIFDTNNAPGMQPVQITQKTRPKTDHYNPFVRDNGGRIGYHRCRSDLLQHGDHIPSNLHKIVSPVKDVGLYRVSGLSPTISKDGSKLAFVDGEFKAVWVADHRGLRIVYDYRGPHRVFSPVWNQNPDKDILYVCIGTSFNADKTLEIYAINNASGDVVQRQRLTYGGYNNAFPSSSPDGSKFVFRSTRDGGVKKYKNLHIMLEAENGQSGIGWETRLTKGPWTDTHCQWSPTGDWIVFSSTRGKPRDADELDNGLDPGYFSVYLVKPSDPMVVIRVMDSMGDLGGHINHPVFSPDGRSIAVTADLAAVSVDPISLPMFMHAVRPYGDIFMIDLDTDNLKNINNFIKGFRRITHSRYECGTPAWTTTLMATATDLDAQAQWNMLPNTTYTPACPYVHLYGGESWHMTGHLFIPKRSC
nr:uncharacterized protein LOC109767595 [Aegilops tauschii subsp. strangulata]